MSTKYRDPKHVPLENLICRLNELANAITRGGESKDRELTMRVPAECDRDADLVIGEAARRLQQAEQENERVRQANLDVMMHFEDMKACKERAEARVAAYERTTERLGLACQRGYMSGEVVIEQIRQAVDQLERGEGDE